MTTTILKLNNVAVGYTQGSRTVRTVASGLNVALGAGELVCLLGRNGAGKSTLLRTIAGMQKPLEGEILLRGKNLHAISKIELARHLSVVLTDRVTAGLTGYEIASLGRSPHTGWSGNLTARDHAIVEESIQAVGAEALAHRYVSELSDGERQKIMLARALAQEPELMVLDEITAFLDLPNRVEIMRILRDLAHRRGRAILLSTHDLELALSTADRIWLLPREGVFTTGTPEDLVLGGIFEAAFTSEGVRFDQEAGSFAACPVFHSDIALSGEGAPARWTRKALERRGYRVGTAIDLSSVIVTVGEIDERPLWKISCRGETHRHESIESLLAGIESVTRERSL